MSSNKKSKSANALEGPVTEVEVEVPVRQVLVRCPGCRADQIGRASCRERV